MKVLCSYFTVKYLCVAPLPTGVPPGPNGGRAPTGVIAIAVGVPIGMGLIATPLCRISVDRREIHHFVYPLNIVSW